MADAGTSLDSGHEEQKSQYGKLRETGVGLERLNGQPWGIQKSSTSHDLMKFALLLHSWSSPGLPIPLSMSGWTLTIDLTQHDSKPDDHRQSGALLRWFLLLFGSIFGAFQLVMMSISFPLGRHSVERDILLFSSYPIICFSSASDYDIDSAMHLPIRSFTACYPARPSRISFICFARAFLVVSFFLSFLTHSRFLISCVTFWAWTYQSSSSVVTFSMYSRSHCLGLGNWGCFDLMVMYAMHWRLQYPAYI